MLGNESEDSGGGNKLGINKRWYNKIGRDRLDLVR